MGSLAADQVGAGAAVNNTTRELGGTLGVAVLGSVFASAYGPRIARAFAPYPVPAGGQTGRPPVDGGGAGRRGTRPAGRPGRRCRPAPSPLSAPD